MSSTDPVSSITNCHRLIVSQYTVSLSRNAQLSQLDLVLFCVEKSFTQFSIVPLKSTSQQNEKSLWSGADWTKLVCKWKILQRSKFCHFLYNTTTTLQPRYANFAWSTTIATLQYLRKITCGDLWCGLFRHWVHWDIAVLPIALSILPELPLCSCGIYVNEQKNCQSF